MVGVCFSKNIILRGLFITIIVLVSDFRLFILLLYSIIWATRGGSTVDVDFCQILDFRAHTVLLI